MIYNEQEVRECIRECRVRCGKDPLAIYVPESVYRGYLEWINKYDLSPQYGNCNMFFIPVKLWEKEEIKYMEPMKITMEWRS